MNVTRKDVYLGYWVERTPEGDWAICRSDGEYDQRHFATKAHAEGQLDSYFGRPNWGNE